MNKELKSQQSAFDRRLKLWMWFHTSRSETQQGLWILNRWLRSKGNGEQMKLKGKRSAEECDVLWWRGKGFGVDGTDVMFLSPFSPDERIAWVFTYSLFPFVHPSFSLTTGRIFWPVHELSSRTPLYSDCERKHTERSIQETSHTSCNETSELPT